MKLSNKILLAFFGFIFIYLSAAFMEVRIAGTPNVINDKNSTAERQDFPAISHLVVDDANHTINVLPGDQARLEVRSFSGNVLKNIKYHLAGDTLHLSTDDSDDLKKIRVNVYVPKTGFSGLTVNKSTVSVEELELERLDIMQNKGRIWMSHCEIKTINVDALGQSYLDCSAVITETLSLELQASQAFFYTPVGVLKGSMKEGSILRMTDAADIQFKKDETSSISFY